MFALFHIHLFIFNLFPASFIIFILSFRVRVRMYILIYSIVYFYLLLASFSALLNYEVGRSLSQQTVVVEGNCKVVGVVVQENYKAVEAVVQENCKVVGVVVKVNYKAVEVAVEENYKVVERGSCKAAEEED